MPTVMRRNYQHATLEFVHSRVVPRYATVIDLRRRRAVHSCDVCPFQSSDGSDFFVCEAIHYGVCIPVKTSQFVGRTRKQKQSLDRSAAPAHKEFVTLGNTDDAVVRRTGFSKSSAGEDASEFLYRKQLELRQKKLQQQQERRREDILPFPQPIPSVAKELSAPVSVQHSSAFSSYDFSKPSSTTYSPAPSAFSTAVSPTERICVSLPETPHVTTGLSRNHSASMPIPSSSAISVSDNITESFATRHGPLVAHTVPISSNSSVTNSTRTYSRFIPLTDTAPKVVDGNAVFSPERKSYVPLRDSTVPFSVGNLIRDSKCSQDNLESAAKTNLIGNLPEQVKTGFSGLNHASSHRQPSSQAAVIPRFYFPAGFPMGISVSEMPPSRALMLFEETEGRIITIQHIASLTKACGFPLYWKYSFFRYMDRENSGAISLQSFLSAWQTLNCDCCDDASRFVEILARPGMNFLEYEDFVPLIQDVVDHHPGLTLLHAAIDFHSLYIQTVIARIFYYVSRSWSGHISAQEIKKSNLLQMICLLETEDDINLITDYFSYEHFYVIYSKFWELDTDHDLFLSKADLVQHDAHAINSKIIDRIFSGAVTKNLVEGKIGYQDFVWFLISEEDKQHPRSVEYWFRCMDLDGDGILSMYEMELFYKEQADKMEECGSELPDFRDCLCQMFDMIQPKDDGKIRLRDLKTNSLSQVFFNTFINLSKYLEQEDMIANTMDPIDRNLEMSDWDRYAAEEYEKLVMEEIGCDLTQGNMVSVDGPDFEPQAVTRKNLARTQLE